MDFTQLKVTKELPIAIIKLNRPEAMNALNSKMVSELVDALTELEKDDEVRCLIITGDERAFSAGADIKEMVGLSTVDLVKTRHFFPLWDKIGHYPKPIIAALSGYVLGGGLELAMSCDTGRGRNAKVDKNSWKTQSYGNGVDWKYDNC